MKILVTGSTGKLGRAVVAELLAHGHEVVATDRRAPEQAAAGPATRLADLTRIDEARPLVREVDVVCHLGNIPWFDEPQYASGFANNTAVNYNVFQAAEEAGVGRVVYASSVQAYGMLGPLYAAPRYLPVDEDHPLLATNPYALSKAGGEAIAESFLRRGKIRQVFSLRYTAILEGPGPVVSPGDPRPQPRSATGSLFTRVSFADAARATRLACEAERAGHTALNIASPRAAAWWRAEDLEEVYGVVPAMRRPLSGGEALISSARAKEILEFEAT
jgi:nucleoside-diphosphate-sugar epimerase